MSAKEALGAFCKDEDLFSGAWGLGSQTSVSLQGAAGCPCDSVDVGIIGEVQDQALRSQPSQHVGPAVSRDLSSNQLRIQVGWAP